MTSKDRDPLNVLHEVRKRHITQRQAGAELGNQPAVGAGIAEADEAGRRPGGGAPVAGKALESKVAGYG